jgi:hypothetical protein
MTLRAAVLRVFPFSYREDPEREPTIHLQRSVPFDWPGRKPRDDRQ